MPQKRVVHQDGNDLLEIAATGHNYPHHTEVKIRRPGNRYSSSVVASGILSHRSLPLTMESRDPYRVWSRKSSSNIVAVSSWSSGRSLTNAAMLAAMTGSTS